MAYPTPRQLEYLASAVELGSFSAAAKAEHVSQAALSGAIAELERVYGVPLFVRRAGRGAAPTQEARRIAAAARSVLRQLDDLAGSLDPSEDGRLVGSVRVGCMAGFSAALIPSLLERARRQHPRLEIDIVEAGPLDLVDELSKGRLDIVLMYDRQLEEPGPMTVLAEVHPHLVLAGDHPLADRASLSLSELEGTPLAVPDLPPAPDRIGSLFLEATGRRPRIAWRCASMETLFAIVGRGMACTLSYLSTPSPNSFEGRPLAFVPIADPVSPNRLVALRAPNAVADPRTAFVIDSAVLDLRALAGRPGYGIRLLIDPPEAEPAPSPSVD